MVASPLREGEFTPWVIENEIPSHGEGEQSTKFGGPCPYWAHPPLFCRFPSTVPVGAGLGGGGGAGGGAGLGGGAGVGGGAGAGACATAIWSDCCFESPVASDTEMPKLKLP